MPHDEPGEPDTATGLVRVRLDLAYDGAGFSGWARQPGRRTVAETVEAALAAILRDREVRVGVAGRTDAGVHASGQVAHVDIAAARWRELEPTLLRRLAGVLPDDVRVTAVAAVPADFDARFSALWRRYRYLVCDTETGVDPLRRGQVLGWPRPLDVDAMAHAATALVGEHDFAAYCRRRDGATTIRTLQRLDVVRADAEPGEIGEIEWTVQADAFCHSMVRSLVGALLAVGDGRRDRDWPASLLTLRARADDVAVAPAHGLTLVAVGYPPPDELASRTVITRRRREIPAARA